MPIGPFPAPNPYGVGMTNGLPEDAQALRNDQAARGGYQQGIGLTDAAPPEIAESASPEQPAGAEAGPAAAAGAPAAATMGSIEADEPLIDYKKDPFGAIGLLLSNVAAGMQGQELPTTTLAEARFKRVQATKAAEAKRLADQFQQAKLGMEFFDAAYKVGLQNPAHVDDLLGQLKIPGMAGVATAVKNAIASKLDRMDQRMAIIRSTQSPRLAEIAAGLLEANDIEGFDKLTGSLIDAEQKINQAGRETAATTGARITTEGALAGTAAGTAGQIAAAQREPIPEAGARAAAQREPIAEAGARAAAQREPIGEAAARAGATAAAQADAAGRAPITPYQQSQIDAGKITQAEAERHNRATELAAQTKANMESADANLKRQATAASYDTTLRTLDKLVGVKDPKTGVRKPARGFREAVGAVGPIATGNILDWNILWPTSGSDRANFVATLDTFKAQTFVPMVQQLVGMGALSNAEGEKLTDAAGALKLEMGEKAFLASADEIRKNLEAARDRIPGVAPRGGFTVEKVEP